MDKLIGQKYKWTGVGDKDTAHAIKKMVWRYDQWDFVDDDNISQGRSDGTPKYVEYVQSTTPFTRAKCRTGETSSPTS